MLFWWWISIQIIWAAAEEKLQKEETTVSAPWPLGPKIKEGPTRVLDEAGLFVTETDGEKRPFYVPGEPEIDVYTETVTETTFVTHRTSKIIDLGTSTTITKSLTVLSTKTLTSTELAMDVSYATTTVFLSQTVFGGTVTKTTIIDTSIETTIYITPVAATSISVVTRFSRTTSTVTVTGTTYSPTLQTTTYFSSDTVTIFSVAFSYLTTDTLSIIQGSVIPITVTSFLAHATSTFTDAAFVLTTNTVVSVSYATFYYVNHPDREETTVSVATTYTIDIFTSAYSSTSTNNIAQFPFTTWFYSTATIS